MKALVTGATGFLGGALARRLARDGIDVIGVGRTQAEGERLTADGVRFFRVDLEDPAAILTAARGRDVIFHSAALTSPWGRRSAFERAHILATENVIAACEAEGARLVHVSTPSVYFDYRPRRGVSEDHVLPVPQCNDYADTKLIAERRVNDAGARGLEVITIRPRAIFGPGDRAVLPRVLRAHQAGRLKIIGAPDTVVDLTFVDNVVDLLLLCADAPATCLGRVYNVTNGDEVQLWERVDQVLQGLGARLNRRRVPRALALTAASLVEAAGRLRPDTEPALTRYQVGVMSTTFTLSIARAQAELGYQPRVSVDEGLERFVRWWRDTRGPLT